MPTARPGEAETPSSRFGSSERGRGAGAESMPTIIVAGAGAGLAPSSPRPEASSGVSAAMASVASGPSAISTTLSPYPISRPMTETTLLALAWSLPRWSRTRDLNFLARLASTAAGRACSPVELGTNTASEVTRCPLSSSPEAARAARSRTRATSLLARTRPDAGRSPLSRSVLMTTIWVSRLLAWVARKSASNPIRGSPAATVWPSVTRGEKPSPLSSTVSSPMCIITSMPSGVVSVTACPARWSWVTVPPQGAVSSWFSGSMDRPSPTIFWANTGSGTCSSGTMTPSSGARSSIVDISVSFVVVLFGLPDGRAPPHSSTRAFSPTWLRNRQTTSQGSAPPLPRRSRR